MLVRGAVLVLVTPAVAEIPNVEADPRSTDGGVAAVTVKIAVAGECGLVAKVAVMVDVPGLTPVARPIVGLVFEIVATPVAPTGTRSTAVQVESAVLSWVVVSLNVSIAVYCWVPVTGIEAVAGVTTNDSDVAVVTVKTASLSASPTVPV
jgi:hypothetical protein